MAFPLTHLCVAWRILENHPMNKKEAAQFLLGSIAPDAVHYRGEFQGAAKKNIGATKKISHLCPVSDEKWGQVTDNEGWVECIKNFLRDNPNDAFAAGYAVHALTDLYNNHTIWNDFRTNHPAEAAKGYASSYYKDLFNIDARLYYDFPAVSQMMELLSKSIATEMPGLVSADETNAIKNNLLHEHFKNNTYDQNHHHRFVTYEDNINFIEAAAEYSANIVFPFFKQRDII